MQFAGIFVQAVPVLKSVCLQIKSGLRYLKLLPYEVWPYGSIVSELDRAFSNLQRDRNRVRHKVKEEENRYGRAIDDDVIKWLKDADDIISEYEDFRLDEERPYAVFSNGYLPKPSIRFRLSREAIDLARRGNLLLRSAKPDWLGRSSTDADFQSFASTNQTKNLIVDALADSNNGVIGVCGCSGVGKTSLIKEVAREVKGKTFDVVIMVSITSSPDIRGIQGQIADKLGMKLEEESESGRAARLRERLKNPKEKTLIILDDMEVRLDFSILGIPFQNTEASLIKTQEFVGSSFIKIQEPIASYKECKILMIFDSEQQLLSQMDGKRIQTFCVKPLAEKEAKMMFKTMAEILSSREKKAETMFKTMAEIIALKEVEPETMFKIMAEMIGDENSKYETLASQIAKRCKGLPMTIVTTAKALKNKSLREWENAYLALGKQNLTATPEFSIKLSYDLLENEELKQTFLICARMGRDALITHLVRYCIALGFLQGIYTAREARDRVYALVGKLKELSLLCDSFSIDRFTMHDSVRDAALSIASQEMHAFAQTKGKLDEWPELDKLERYTAISLQHCDVTEIMEKFPKGINCVRLRVFHLDNTNPRLIISDEIFYEMKELRVLTLTGINLSPLPSSIKCLKELRMLCLERCKLGERLSIIGELKELRVLSLSGSDMERLPVQLRQLAKLQIFDLSNCFKLKEIPADVLLRLISLEELYVGKITIQAKDEEGQENQSGNASLSVLRQLNQLTALDILIRDVANFPKNLFFDQLDSYKIIIRDFNASPMWDFKMETEASRYLALQLEKGFAIHNRMEIKLLFKRVESLLLGQLNDVEDIFKELNYEGFPYLKYLSILSNSKVKSIINSEKPEYLERAFPKLESLFLYEVNNMEHICHSQLTNDSFCKLKIIKLKICGQLKNVFFSSLLKHLSALEILEVSECNSLKEIVTLESIGDKIKFPKLRSLTLQSLIDLIGFYTLDASIQEQESNRNPDEHLDEEQEPNWNPGDQLFDEEVVVFKLERMELSSIKIRKIWNEHPSTRLYFQNLIHLDVNDCWNLRYLLSLSMSKGLMNLQSLFISECGMMETIFKEIKESMIETEGGSIFPNLKNINLTSMKRLRQIWHPKLPLHSFGNLHALTIDRCNKLENVFPSYMVGSFISLCDLKVTNCKSIEEIFDLKGVGKHRAWDMITSLQNVHVKALPKLGNVWNEDPGGILRFTYLKKIWVQECLNLKYLFPVSIARDLKNLEYLEVLNCGQLKEIVFTGEKSMTSFLFEFPKLTTARFSKLPNLESFFGGTHKLRCSTLNNISVEHCHKLKLFRTDIKNPLFLPEEVICNLKSMQIETHDASSIKGQRMHKLEDCQLSRLVDTEILYFLLHRNPNLKSILLSNCFFEQLVPPRSPVNENFGVVPMLKSLKLMNLPSLKRIGFEEYMVLFRMLECLVLKKCPSLNTIAPATVSFTYLKNLEVSNCNKLSYLMTPSTAKSLVQLTTMKVVQCKSMLTIVSEPENAKWIIFSFRQLKEIELHALHELQSFCSSDRCAIGFPSLEKLVVSACRKMERFTFSEQANKTPNLREVCVENENEEKILYWEGDLNTTIQHVYKMARDRCRKATSHPYKPLEISQLKTLKLSDIALGSEAIPTYVFSCLMNLEELEVSRTNVEVIFGKMETDMKGYPFPLKKLMLNKLWNLEGVWRGDCEETINFKNLQEVLVTNCQQLKTLFPVELAKKVENLKKLEIRHCQEFLNIVEKENATNQMTEKFAFPRLISLDLHMLPGFHPGGLTLECPELSHLEVLFCGDFNLETFQIQDKAQVTSVNRQPFFSKQKAIFILESLKLDWKNTTVLCNENFPKDMLHELVQLELDFDDVDKVSDFPIEILKKASNLEYLQISRCRGLEELTPSLHSAVSFSNLKQLSVKNCDGLNHLFTSSTARKLVHLEEMYVVNCEAMKEILAKDLVEEAIKFERLTTITLDSLPSLSCFYSGNEGLHLSSLLSVRILQCPNMEIFSRGNIDAKSFMGIQVSSTPEKDLLFYQDLNTAVKLMFEQGSRNKGDSMIAS